jgi:hypothetical protein
MKKIVFVLFIISILIFFSGCLIGKYDEIKPSPYKAIIIEHIGNSDKPLDKIIINTHNDGYLTDYFWMLTHYIRVQEPFFIEIIELINKNKDLFDEKRLTYEFGSFQLNIENEESGTMYCYYLNGRKNALIFFKQLDELVTTKHNYDTFKTVLKSLLGRLGI